MNPINTLFEEIIIVTICLIVFTLFVLGQLCSWGWTTFLVPLVAALLIGGFLRIRLYYILRKLNGEYEQYNIQANLIPHKKNVVRFDFRNLFRIRPILYINQISDAKGSWESFITVSGLNPLVSSGFFKYSTSGNKGGGKEGDWGVHELHINPEDEIIHVKVINKPSSRIDEYILKKKKPYLVNK